MFKNSRNILGKVVCLVPGYSAVIELADGSTVATSSVERIMASDGDFVSFETENTVYVVTKLQCFRAERISNPCLRFGIGERHMFYDEKGNALCSAMVTAVMRDAYFSYVFTSNGKVYMKRHMN